MGQTEDLKQLNIVLAESRSEEPVMGWTAILHLSLIVLLTATFIVGTASFSKRKVKVAAVTLSTSVRTEGKEGDSLLFQEKNSSAIPSVLLPDFSLPPDVEDEYHEVPIEEGICLFPEVAPVDGVSLLFPVNDEINDIASASLLASADTTIKGTEPLSGPANASHTPLPVKKAVKTVPKPAQASPPLSEDGLIAIVATLFDELSIEIDHTKLFSQGDSLKLPRWLNFPWFVKKLSRKMHRAGLSNIFHKHGKVGNTENLSIRFDIKPVCQMRFHKNTAQAKVAVIVDDCGSGGSSTASLMNVRAPLTIAVMPFLKGSVSSAQQGLDRSFEVILHMPMEPKRFKNNVRRNIAALVELSAEEIRRRLARALDSLPTGVAGMNNHMGSLFSEISTKLKPVMEELRSRGLFFVDSVTSRKSLAYQVARLSGLPAGRRNFEFIDNKRSVEYAAGQFRKLITRCRKKDRLICIMHDRKNSIAALKQMLKKIREAGIELTYVSELLEGDDVRNILNARAP